ncbi:MAG TPA: adenylyltransferase/cytidyltransferase family protein [Verrucomicrobiae bacterium]|jgi:cytidyltransferase-like protein|nr:adenylyltransferase/cytidyltransferase family protein [Verrucomicrobiae bacterium]
MSNIGKIVIVSGLFDDIRSRDFRFLQEAAKLGELRVHLCAGGQPKFSPAERKYFLQSNRFVSQVYTQNADMLPEIEGLQPDMWADVEGAFNQTRRQYCDQRGLDYHVVKSDQLGDFPELPPNPPAPDRKKVIVTGSFDWFHSGHIRFFEEAAGFGNLYVIVGHDANIRLLKGPQHPLLPQAERLYMAGSIRFVTHALISTGSGWLDAEPEIERLKPDIYIVNEDGDKGGKRDYCEKAGIEYIVLKRKPAPGLATRSSTDLRGF